MTHIMNMKQGLHPPNYAWSPMMFSTSSRQFPEFKSKSPTPPQPSLTTKSAEIVPELPEMEKTACPEAPAPISQYCQILSGCRKKKKRRRRRNKKKNKQKKHEDSSSSDESCRRKSVEVIIRCESPGIRQRSVSTTSDDSFIICFDGDSSSEAVLQDCSRGRQRQISTASDDSFIYFDRGVSSVDCDETDDDESEDENTESLDSCESLVPNKKVRFADNLCHVHPMIKWSFAYQSARKGPWEECARDRDRFNRRIRETEQKLAPIFNCEHRTKVFNQRFVDDQSGNYGSRV